MTNPKDVEWLHTIVLFKSVEQVTESNPKAKKCLEKRSEDPSDYMDLIHATLKYLGKSIIQKFGEAGKSLKRKKDNEESRKLREAGNKIFLTVKSLQCLEESLELFTQSIAYAIPNTPEMAKGFANRSAVLLRLNRPLESLEDIARALKSNYPKELIPKLIIRKAECFSMLANHSCNAAKFWLKQVPENDPDRKTLKKYLKDYSTKDYKYTVDEVDPVVPEIASPHAEFHCASDAVDIEYNSGPNGKRIVATRDVKVGEVLIVEKAYLSYLTENAYYTHCFFCTTSFWNGIPCDNCPNVVYCSEKCKLAAWKEYHNVECPVLSLILQNREAGNASFVSRMSAALKLGIKFTNEAGGLNTLQDRIKKFQGYNGILKDEWYENQTLENVLSLTRNIKQISNKDFQITTSIVIFILFHLATTTNFLGTKYERDQMSDKNIVLSMAKNKEAQFVGGLLILTFLHVKFHSGVIKEKLRELNFPNLYGYAVSPFTQIMTRQCYYNTLLQFVGGHVIAQSFAPIKKGEEVVVCRDTWMYIPKEKRRPMYDWLAECSCRACVENWPTQEHLESFEQRAKSPQSRAILQKVLQPLQSIQEEVAKRQGKVKDYDNTVNTLSRMMEVVYQEVNLPCKEQLAIYEALTKIYIHTGLISKMSCKLDMNVIDLIEGKLPDDLARMSK